MTNTNDMTIGSPTRGILRFAVPLILGYILQQMYLIIDAAIVGRWIGVNALAAVGASTSIMFLILGFCNGCCAGFAIPIAQSFGAKDYTKMRSYVGNALRIGVVLAIVITLLACIFCTRLLKLVNTPIGIFHDAYIFLLLQFLAIPFIFAYNLFSGFIRALGNSKEPFYFLILSSFLNILLDIILIIILKMGVAGAGLATMISQVFAVLLCCIYIKRKLRILIPQGKERQYDNKRISILLNNGVPMGLQFSITGIGIIMLQSANNALGTIYVAAFTASIRIKYLFTCVFENIGVAMATYCGQNIGAKDTSRVALGVRSAIKIMLVYFVITVLLIYPFADDMMSLFVKSGETSVINNAAMLMRIANFFYPALGILTILRYSIQGLGYSNLSMMSGVMEMIARCIVSIWMVPALKFLGVCYGDPVAWCMADMFLIPGYIWLYHHLKKKMALEKQSPLSGKAQ
ncbi:MAG: MATE family efflux transporter [Prevotella sp.]|jgi:putative MATE family efflux protein|uniref:Multidrug-efflux transporter n=1 Tax=Segatella cerevisiae TaxID=2053716 RepID=A0ABT1BWM4_9BACT|nr:MATE family efflux transporter [Segatella cerevisiae]MCH3994630.1 MATE family efflux transporter [Prevotella sp.]MCI1246297.1 MATE family efflux transporter [Prevotella sp.]MCO6025484.1 MATE family efflux transporter [Segatella cerevisiae]